VRDGLDQLVLIAGQLEGLQVAAFRGVVAGETTATLEDRAALAAACQSRFSCGAQVRLTTLGGPPNPPPPLVLRPVASSSKETALPAVRLARPVKVEPVPP
jgi:hypothetical protein